MPARKNRPDKAGIGVLNSVEKMCLRYWFTEGRNKFVWVDPDDVVWGGHGFDSGWGSIVRGLVTKGCLERREVRGESDWKEGATVQYFLTEKGREFAPNAP
jgi:hypothetical protein